MDPDRYRPTGDRDRLGAASILHVVKQHQGALDLKLGKRICLSD
jgi:hypothetical protein